MEIKKLALSVGLAVAALGSVSAAQAVPMLQIVDGAGGLAAQPPLPPSPPYPGNAEAIGDPGGTLYTNGPTPGASAGPGMPTDLGGWPNTTPPAGYPPGFAPDPSFNNAYGISGWDASYLNLTQDSNVTFQFMGKGNATNHNVFQVDLGAGFVTIWDSWGDGVRAPLNGTCGMSGPTSPDCSFPGSQVTKFFTAGLIPFQFINLDTLDAAINDGTNNPSPDKTNHAGYFLGMDPYLASGAFDNTGRVTYAGFTDMPVGTGGDHDYEDLIVRMSVPEPGSIFLLGAGLLGLSGMRKRKA